MLRAQITLTWPDGQTASATLQAVSAEANYPIKYSGAVTRLVDAPASADLAFLSFCLKTIAAETGATYSEHHVGKYDRWAGGPCGL